MKSIESFVENDMSHRILLSEMNKSHFDNKELGITIVNNGYVLPFREWDSTGSIANGGIVDERGRYVHGTCFGWDKESAIYDFDKQNVKACDECIYLGYFHAVYGHAITDALKKLWYFQTEECKSLISRGVDVIYLTTSNRDLPTWHKQLFKLAGIDVSECKHIQEISKYKKIIVPQSSWWRRNDGTIFFNKGFEMVVNKIKSNVRKTSDYKTNFPSNLYFTRTAIFDVCREIGENDLVNFFRKNGYHVFSPEKLSLEQQISMLMKCKRFAATEGSCSHAQLFCNPDVEVIILRKADYINSYTTAIADFTNCKTIFVDANKSILASKKYPWRGPFYLTVTEELRKCFGISGGLPFIIRPSYWVYRFQKTIIGKKILYIYYLWLIARSKLGRR